MVILYIAYIGEYITAWQMPTLSGMLNIIDMHTKETLVHSERRESYVSASHNYTYSVQNILTYKHKNKIMGLIEKLRGTLKRHFYKMWIIWILL